LYLVVFATGNVQHDYYQYLIVPALVIFVSRGFLLLLRGIEGFIARIWTIPLAFLSLGLCLYLTYWEVRGLYQINNPVIVEAGALADQILPKDAKVIASYNGDSSFLYQTNRAGLPNVPLPITEVISKFGIAYYISTAHDSKTNWVLRYFQPIEKNDKFVIVDLTKQVKPFNKSDPEPN
jgi:hypothetical protein